MPTRPNIKIIPIIPKLPISKVSKAKVSARLRRLGQDMVRAAANYPTQKPTTYRRTGDLGKKWTMKGPLMQGSDLVVEVGNVMDYTGYVMGLKSGRRGSVQLSKFADLGWQSIENIAREEVDKAKPDMEQVLQDH